jgi:hypothetical protein
MDTVAFDVSSSMLYAEHSESGTSAVADADVADVRMKDALRETRSFHTPPMSARAVSAHARRMTAHIPRPAPGG